MGDTSIFDAYQEEFVKDAEEFRRSISSLAECDSNQDQKRSAINSCDSSIDKITNLLKEMEMEVRTYTSNNKRICNEVLSRDKDEFTTLKSDYNKAKFAAEKASLTGGRSGEDRRRMLDTNEKLTEQNLALERATRIVAETEEIGNETIGELGRNREAIESARGKAQETSSMADGVQKTITRMMKREWSLGFWS